MRSSPEPARRTAFSPAPAAGALIPAAAGTPRHVVCGLDELGFRCAEELARLGEPVIVVAAEHGSKFEHRLERIGVPILIGNYRDDQVLLKAGVAAAPSVIIAESDDAANLHAALAAREANPDVRIVLRIFNAPLGRRVADVFPGAVVLSSSVIAAPAFVSAALETDFEQRVDVDGRTLILRHAGEEEEVLLPVASTTAAGGLVLFPEQADKGLCLVAAPADGGRRRPARPGGLRHLVLRELRATWHLITTLADVRLRYVALSVAAIVLVSTVFFAGFGNLNPFDSLYFVVTTITTIGYGDITMLSAPVPVRIYSMALELVGAAVLAVSFAVITDALVGVRLRHALGGPHREMDDHVIVCGVGNIGHRVVEELHDRHVPVLAMEANQDAKALPHLRQRGIPILIGDAREASNLNRTQIATARCLVVATDDDLSNLEIALTARSLNPALKVVMQLGDPDLAERVQRSLGVGVSRSPAGIAAPAFVSAAIGHDVISTIAVGDRMLVVARATVEDGSEAGGRDLAWLHDGPYARVLALKRDGAATWTPGSDAVVRAGDELVVVATRKGLDGLLRRCRPGAAGRGAQLRSRGLKVSS